MDDVTYTIDDGLGHTYAFNIPAGPAVTFGLQPGPNVAQEVIMPEDHNNHLKYHRSSKMTSCPRCQGLEMMQVTSDQGVFVYEPGAGQVKLPSNSMVDDGVNGVVTIHTSGSAPIEVGDEHGAYTISDLIKIFEQENDD